MNYRLRNTDDGLLVLQIGEYPKATRYDYGMQSELVWRDAKITDIPVYNLFQPPAPDCRPAFDNGTPIIKTYSDTAA